MQNHFQRVLWSMPGRISIHNFTQTVMIGFWLCSLTAIADSSTSTEEMHQLRIQQSWEDEFQTIQNSIDSVKGQSRLGKRVQSDQVLDPQSLISATDKDPTDVILRRVGALLDHQGTLQGSTSDLVKWRHQYNDLCSRAHTVSLGKKTADHQSGREQLYYEAAALRRSVALSNPLLDFNDIIYVETERSRSVKSGHMCRHYLGWVRMRKGGLYICKDFKTNPQIINLTEGVVVENGRFAGKTLDGGGFMAPDLSYDGKKVVFAWVEPGPIHESHAKEFSMHLFSIDTDGTNLRQLTDGPHDDFDPLWLPGDDRIVFVSERRGGYARCNTYIIFPTWTLFSMKPDGSDIVCLSYHETNEWQPSVDNDGMLVYTRWDYVDRNNSCAQFLWRCYPDGRDPRAPHANYFMPLSTVGWTEDSVSQYFPEGFPAYKDRHFFAQKPEAMEWNIRAIPNTTGEYISALSGHHKTNQGDLIHIDIKIKDDNDKSQVTLLNEGRYLTPWPLSRDYYLCGLGNELYLLDRFGNHELIVEGMDEEGEVVPMDPIPLQARLTADGQPVHPRIPTRTWDGERSGLPDHKPATITVANVYDADWKLPPQQKVKWMRIVQLLPNVTSHQDNPLISPYSISAARMPLGVVPVDADGSVYCEAPINKALYFQLLDERGLAVRSMRSATYVHSGEQLSCAGCHEDKWGATPPSNPSAVNRDPSPIVPEVVDGAIPYNWYRLVKPVFESKCIPCHSQKENKNAGAARLDDPFKIDKKYLFGFEGMGKYGDPYTNSTRTTPMRFGAMESKLFQTIDKPHHDLSLTPEELRRITLWLDMNCNVLGTAFDNTHQERGGIAWSPLDVDPANPIGTEFPSSLKASGIRFSSPEPLILPNAQFQFSAYASDELGRPVGTVSNQNWTVTGGGDIDGTSGLFTPTGDPGIYTVSVSGDIGAAPYTCSERFYLGAADSSFPLDTGYIGRFLALHDGWSYCVNQSNETLPAGDENAHPREGDEVMLGSINTQWKVVRDGDGYWDVPHIAPWIFYMASYIVSPTAQKVKFRYGVDNSRSGADGDKFLTLLKIRLNGSVCLENEDEAGKFKRNILVDPEFSDLVQLEEGENLLLVRMEKKCRNGVDRCSHSGTPGLALSFVDENGDPVENLRYKLSSSEVVASTPLAASVASIAPRVHIMQNAIRVFSPWDKTELRLFTVSGRCIMHKRYPEKGMHFISLPLLANGVYVARLKSRDGVWTKCIRKAF